MLSGSIEKPKRKNSRKVEGAKIIVPHSTLLVTLAFLAVFSHRPMPEITAPQIITPFVSRTVLLDLIEL